MKEYNKKKSRLKYISKETMKEYKQELYAVASMVLLAFFYVVTLCCLPQIVPEYFLHSILQWLDYLRYFVCGSFGAFFLIQGFLRLSAWKKKSASIWWFIAAAAFFVNKDILCWWRYKFYVQQMLLLLWPVLVSYAAVYMRKNKPFSVKLIAFESSLCIPLNRCLYYILTVMATWFVVVFLRYSYYDDVNLWNTCYLLLCSAGAWHMAGRKLHEKDKKLSYVVTGILAIAAFACFAVKNSRLLEIVYTSLANPKSAIYGENKDVNWLANRLQMMEDVWLGNVHVYEENTMYAAYHVPLAIVKGVWGYLGVLAILALAVCMFYKLFQIYRGRRQEGTDKIWDGMILFALAATAVLAFDSNLLLVTDSAVGLLMLNNKKLVVLVLLFLFAGNEKYLWKSKWKLNFKLSQDKMEEPSNPM